MRPQTQDKLYNDILDLFDGERWRPAGKRLLPVRERYDISYQACWARLKMMLEEGVLERHGNTRAARYRVKTNWN